MQNLDYGRNEIRWWQKHPKLDEALGIAIIILIVALTIYVSFIEPNFENLPIRELDF